MIDGDGEWHAELIRPRVPLADGHRGGVQLGGDALGGQDAGDGTREIVHARVVDEGEDGALDGRDDGREPEHRLLLILWSDEEGVLEHAVHDATDTEGGLDDGRGEVTARDLLRLHGDLDHPGEDLHGATLDFELGLSIRLDLGGERERILLAQRHERVGHRLGVFLERLAHVLLVGLHHEGLHHLRLREPLVRGELNLALVRVSLEVKRGAIREADALYPAVRALDLGVPAVLGVMRHLVLQVLAEPKPLRVDPDLLEEGLRARDEVSERLIGDDALLHSLTDGHGEGFLHRAELRVAAEERQHHVGHLRESRVVLLLGVHEVLNLSLRELSHAEETGARSDLVSEGLADLRGGEREFAAVVVEEIAEVDEDALRRLRSEVPLQRAGWANLRGKHEVEGVGGGEVVLGLRGLDGELGDGIAHLLRGELLEPREHVLELLALVRGDHGVGEHPLQVFLHQVVRPEAVLGDDVVDHEVGELLYVAGSLEHHLRSHGRALHLEHGLVEDEVLAPERLEVGLDGASGRAVVVEARDAAVDLERGDVEQPLLERAVHLGAELLFRRGRLVARRHGSLDLGVELELELLELGDRGIDLSLVLLLGLQRADVVAGVRHGILHGLKARGVVGHGAWLRSVEGWVGPDRRSD